MVPARCADRPRISLAYGGGVGLVVGRGSKAQASRPVLLAVQGAGTGSAPGRWGLFVRVLPHMSVGVRPDVSVPAGGSWHGVGVRGERRAVFKPVAGSVDADHVAVVQEPVEDGGGQDVVGEHAAPFAEGLVAGAPRQIVWV